MLLVEWPWFTTTISFLAHLLLYVYTRLYMGASNYARPYWIIHSRGRQRFSCFFLLLCRIGREKRAPFSPTFLLSFLLSTFFSDVQSGQEEIRPFSWRNILEILRAESLFWFFSRIFSVKQRISRLEFLFVEAVLFFFGPHSQEIPEEKNVFLPFRVKITDSRRYVSLESVIVSKFLYFLVTIERYVSWLLKEMINFLRPFNIVKSFLKSV